MYFILFIIQYIFIFYLSELYLHNSCTIDNYKYVHHPVQNIIYFKSKINCGSRKIIPWYNKNIHVSTISVRWTFKFIIEQIIMRTRSCCIDLFTRLEYPLTHCYYLLIQTRNIIHILFSWAESSLSTYNRTQIKFVLLYCI